jgi:hypothetical protein
MTQGINQKSLAGVVLQATRLHQGQYIKEIARVLSVQSGADFSAIKIRYTEAALFDLNAESGLSFRAKKPYCRGENRAPEHSWPCM